MTQRARAVALAIIVLTLPLAARAQKVELALTAGGDFISNPNYTTDRTWAIQGSFARRVAWLPLVSAYFELPVGASFDTTPNLVTIGQQLRTSSLFVTPGLKVKLTTPVFQPYAVAGVGLGHFSMKAINVGSTTSASSNNLTVGFGGGVDTHFLPFLALRGEVRDYFSGQPEVGFSTSGRQHNVFVTGGLVLRF